MASWRTAVLVWRERGGNNEVMHEHLIDILSEELHVASMKLFPFLDVFVLKLISEFLL